MSLKNAKMASLKDKHEQKAILEKQVIETEVVEEKKTKTKSKK